jgi:hypothetical protein
MAEIIEKSLLIQHGLYQELHSFFLGNVKHTHSHLYSSEGYCFYDITEEIYREDENGNFYLVPNEEVLPTERKYMRKCITPITDTEEIKKIYIVVPIEKGMEIV